MDFHYRKIYLVIIILFLALTVGCASIVETPIVESMPKVNHFDYKPSAFLDLKTFRGLRTDMKPRPERSYLAPWHKKNVKKVVDDYSLFSSYASDPAEEIYYKDFTIKLYLYVYHTPGIKQFLTFTFGLIPILETRIYELDAEVLDKYGKSLKKYKSRGEVHSYVSIIRFLELYRVYQMSHTVMNNMVKDVFKKMIDDGVLTYSNFEDENK